MLFFVTDREPIFDEQDARADQHLFKLRNAAVELLQLFISAEPHDTLNPGAVVPAAVKEDDLTCRGKVRCISLEIPLCPLACVGGRQGSNPADPRVESLGNSLYGATLARSISTLKDHHQLEALVNDPILELDEFSLEAKELPEVGPPVDSTVSGAG